MSDYSDDVDLILDALTDGDFMFFIDDFSYVCDYRLHRMAFEQQQSSSRLEQGFR